MLHLEIGVLIGDTMDNCTGYYAVDSHCLLMTGVSFIDPQTILLRQDTHILVMNASAGFKILHCIIVSIYWTT